jgi:hypothetical protein
VKILRCDISAIAGRAMAAALEMLWMKPAADLIVRGASCRS